MGNKLEMFYKYIVTPSPWLPLFLVNTDTGPVLFEKAILVMIFQCVSNTCIQNFVWVFQHALMLSQFYEFLIKHTVSTHTYKEISLVG